MCTPPGQVPSEPPRGGRQVILVQASPGNPLVKHFATEFAPHRLYQSGPATLLPIRQVAANEGESAFRSRCTPSYPRPEGPWVALRGSSSSGWTWERRGARSDLSCAPHSAAPRCSTAKLVCIDMALTTLLAATRTTSGGNRRSVLRQRPHRRGALPNRRNLVQAGAVQGSEARQCGGIAPKDSST